jgi:catechol 2,3-dioxygenase-like lactoylglutathione lyase family enzyme
LSDSFKTRRRGRRILLAMNILFISSFAIVTPDQQQSRRLYVDALGLPLKSAEGDEYLHSEEIAGSKHFGVWPLSQAAQACFGTSEWPSDVPVPQASVEFELESAEAVSEAAAELEGKGYESLHPARTEPWGQLVSRILSPEGAIVGLSYAPSLHDS